MMRYLFVFAHRSNYHTAAARKTFDKLAGIVVEVTKDENSQSTREMIREVTPHPTLS